MQNQDDTALLDAAETGLVDTVLLLLDRGVDVQHTNKNGHSPLLVASCCGHTNIVRLLLDRGANVHQADNRGQSPLCLASALGHVEIERLLTDQLPVAIPVATRRGLVRRV